MFSFIIPTHFPHCVLSLTLGPFGVLNSLCFLEFSFLPKIFILEFLFSVSGKFKYAVILLS